MIDVRDAARRRGPAAGFALFELIVAVLVLSVLASIALPSLDRLMRDARRQDARDLLRLNAQRLQRCFTLEGVYDGSCWLRTESDAGHYRLEDEPDIEASSYTLRAVPVEGGPQASDAACTAFVYEHTGATGATGTDPDACW